jgi:hypothetical protein
MKLDPEWIMATLRRLLADYEQTSGADDWHMLIRVTYRPRDGSGGVTFTVGTEPADDDDD